MSTNYSGSTLLGAMLGHHRDAMFLGEPALILRKRATGEWRHRAFCAICSAGEKASSCPVWTPETIEAIRTKPDEVYRIVAQRFPDPRVLIDASKDTDWLRASVRRATSVSCIHLIRPVESHLASIATRNPLNRSSLEVLAAKWAKVNLEIESVCSSLGIAYKALRYTDLVAQPEATLQDLAPLTTLVPRAGQHEFWNEPVHFIKSNPGILTHYDAGLIAREPEANREMYTQNHRRIFLDEKWRNIFSDAQLERMYAAPHVVEVSQKFGLLPTSPEARMPSSYARARAHATVRLRRMAEEIYGKIRPSRRP